MPRVPSCPHRAARLAVVTGAVLLALPAAPTTPAAAAPRSTHVVTDPALARTLGRLLRDSRVRHARSSTSVMDTASGSLLYSRFGATARTPASNFKLLTAAAAMERLGPGFRFHTDVVRRGPITNATLDGDLYLRGYGDPTTMASDYASLARQVRAAGIRTVTGDLAVDSSFFDAQTFNPHWSKAYADAYYAAPIRPLTIAPTTNYDSGTILIDYRPGKRGHHPVITTTPAAARGSVVISNRATTNSAASSLTVSRRYRSNVVTVSGHLRAGSRPGWAQVTVNRPDLVAAGVFRDALRRAGVTVRGRTTSRTIPAGGQQRVAVDRSMTLAQLLVSFLKLSNNMHAETLTKTMGALESGGGSWSRGLAVTRGYLTSIGVPMSGVRMVDGSGLSADDRLTTRAAVTLLTKVTREPWFAAYYRALPVAGDSRPMVGGTLSHRMRHTAAAGNAHAKTGSLTGVTALSGYVRGADGHRYAFSMISNYRRTTPRPVEDEVVVALARWRRP